MDQASKNRFDALIQLTNFRREIPGGRIAILALTSFPAHPPGHGTALPASHRTDSDSRRPTAQTCWVWVHCSAGISRNCYHKCSGGACAGDDPVGFGGIQRRSAAESALYGLRL